MSVHRCALPIDMGSSPTWRCPTCQTRYVWTKRWVSGKSVEGWSRMHDDFETRRLRNEASFKREAWRFILIGVIGLLAFVALVVWIVLRVTS